LGLAKLAEMQKHLRLDVNEDDEIPQKLLKEFEAIEKVYNC
jgi:hypothetical protein